MKLFLTALTVGMFGLLAIWSGCEDPNPIDITMEDTISFEERLALEEDSINDYVEDQAFDSVFVTSSGLRVIPVKLGNGESTQFGDILTLDILGTLLDGSIFETTDEAVTNNLNFIGAGATPRVRNLPTENLPDGVNEGLALMEEGARYIFIMPSHLAFGAQGAFFFSIGPHRIVQYDITLKRIRR